MKSQDTKKSSEELQREVHGQIDKIGKDIDQARSRLSPGAILDDAIFYPHGQSLTATYSHLKENPMGTMFLSLGTLLLMEDQQRMSYESHLKSSVGGAVDRSRVQYHDTKERVSERVHEIGDQAREKVQEVKGRFQSKSGELKQKGEELKSRAQSKGEELKSRAQSKGEELKSRAESKGEELKSQAQSKGEGLKASRASSGGRVKEKAHELKDRGSEKLQQAKSAASQRYQEARGQLESSSLGQALHPFAIASMGLGLGASLGASFPVPAAERKMSDEKFGRQIDRFSKDVDNAIRESGERIKNHLIDELKQFNFH